MLVRLGLSDAGVFITYLPFDVECQYYFIHPLSNHILHVYYFFAIIDSNTFESFAIQLCSVIWPIYICFWMYYALD